MNTTVTNSLELPPNIDSVAAFIEAAMETHVFPNNYPGHLPARIKWILTELVTNAYKHADITRTNLFFHNEANTITIIKTDIAAPPSFYTQCLAAKDLRINIYEPSTVLFAEKINDEMLVFNENIFDNAIPSIDMLCEHFGLLIITRSCDGFTFHYNATTQTNTFKAVINY